MRVELEKRKKKGTCCDGSLDSNITPLNEQALFQLLYIEIAY